MRRDLAIEHPNHAFVSPQMTAFHEIETPFGGNQGETNASFA